MRVVFEHGHEPGLGGSAGVAGYDALGGTDGLGGATRVSTWGAAMQAPSGLGDIRVHQSSPKSLATLTLRHRAVE